MDRHPPGHAVQDDLPTGLHPLHARTKGNRALKAEIIKLYLAQTPEILDGMISAVRIGDLSSLKSAVHKLIPSFSILGLKSNPEILARKILLCIHTNELHGLRGLVIQLEDICRRSCEALRPRSRASRSVSSETSSSSSISPPLTFR